MASRERRELMLLDRASRMLAEATSVDEIKVARNAAEAARTYAKAAKLGLELQNRAAEIKLRAERKVGAVLLKLQLRGGDRKSARREPKLTLDEIGVSRSQSKRWQLAASIPPAEFDRYVKAKTDLGEEITTLGVYRLARELRRKGASRNSHREGPRNLSCEKRRFAKSDIGDLIEELNNHRNLLANLLRPLYDGGELAFKQSERRVVGRLLKEMDELLGELGRQSSAGLA